MERQTYVFSTIGLDGLAADDAPQDTDAINRAISDMGRCGNLTCQSSSVEPALVYFPAGKVRSVQTFIDALFSLQSL
jgi:hypothetical protein